MKKNNTRKTTEDFILESQMIWGLDQFDYSLTQYKNHKTKLKLICKKHNLTLEQTPGNNLEKKQCCPKCLEDTRLLRQKEKESEIILRFKEAHGDKYEYSKVNFVNTNTPVTIFCKTCSKDFEQIPKSHLNGHGCKTCSSKNNNSKSSITQKGSERKIVTLDSVLEEFKEIHGDKYDYSLITEYKNRNQIIKIICKEHGVFEQKICDHKNGSGCKTCSTEKKKALHKNDLESVLNKFKMVHGDKYDYSLIKEYENNRTKLPIKCKEKGHGIFFQNADKHSSGQNCPICSKINHSKGLLLSEEEILKRFKKKFPNNLFNYDKMVYQGIEKPIIVQCNKEGHTDFEVTPYAHLHGQGCPKCASTRGELEIANVLESLNLSFEQEKKFDNLTSIKSLRFDFYIEKKNLLIEFDGEQHFKPVKFGGISDERATELFHNSQARDIIKNKFALREKYNLLRIPYWEFNNIAKIIKKYLKSI